MNSSAIQSHLYNSLLTGQTSDICIRITGAFDATYHLHRVVLIQAGFWRDLFTGGFAESSAKRQTTGFKSGTRIDSHNSLSSYGAEILDVVLDDRNISRAAFELSISRLYGGGPPLYIHSSLLSTSTHPLTFGFPYQPALSLSSSLLYPPGHQPATPEFLISLLATSIYLSIPSLASEALTGILKTIGPRTVVYYLRFALGRSRLKESAGCSAVGLEGLADVDIDETVFPQSTNIPAENRNSTPSSVGDDTIFFSASHTATNKDSHLSEYTGSPSSQLPFYYGPISDKIGEACACWLARWGADMFVDEEKVVLEWLNDPSASLESWTSKEERALENPPLSSNTDSNGSSLPTTSTWSPKWSQSTLKSIPRVFTATAAEQEGLSLSWIQALISSDDFFVPAPSLYDSVTIMSTSTQSTCGGASSRNTAPPLIPDSPEEERYALAKRVVELRRAVRSKVRQLRRKQSGVDEENEGWETFSSPQQQSLKGKERQLNPLHIDVSCDDAFSDGENVLDYDPSDYPEVSSHDEWKQWSENWQNECREEEAQWDVFFRTSIYYMNMSSEAVIKISKDISHSTGRAYVDLRTLQEAAWEAGLTKSMITGGNSNDTSLLNATDKVGLTKTVSDTLSTLPSDSSFDNANPYFIIPSNESLRIGDTITSSGGVHVEGNIHNNVTMDELFASSFGQNYLYHADYYRENKGIQRIIPTVGNAALDNDQTGERSKAEKIAPIAKTSNEQTFFGLRGNICHVTRTEDPDVLSFVFPTAPYLRSSYLQLPPSQLLSAHPPLRFSVEFFNLEMLKEKDRLHSRTVWFAGSLWNVYVQIVKRKEKSNPANGPDTSGEVQRYRSPGSGLLPNYQLGVYLHRQSPTEKIPPFSAPDPFAGTRWTSKPHSDPTSSSSSTAYSPSSPNSPATLNNLQVPRSQQSLPSSSPPSPSQRSYAFSPLTAYASAPQGASPSVTTSHSPSPSSRLRGNSASSPATPSSHPSTAPGSPSPSGRPRTPGGSGGWRNLATPHHSSSANSILSGSNFLSSSLPTVFPTFGRTRHQSPGSRDGPTRNMNYGIPGASASSPYVGGSTSNSLSSAPTASLAAVDPAPSVSLSPSTDPPLPIPPFHAVVDSKPKYPYCDPRQVVSVYFSINCASPTGGTQIRFRSAPDVFKVGQSWGWKSSGLLGEMQGSASTNVSNIDGDFEAALVELDRNSPPVGTEVSFRATVVLGIV